MQQIRRPFFWTIFLILIFVMVSSILFYPSNTISYDVFGYYIYLPLTFIFDGDSQEALNYLNEIRVQYSSSETLYQVQILPEGNFVMKYNSGWSICYAPFFFIGHLIASITSYPADGFSLPYQIAVFFGSTFYTILGLVFLIKILRSFFNQWLTVALIIILIFGTNYLIHITFHGQNAMTHNIVFTAYTIIIWLTMKWYKSQKRSTLIYLAITCGLLILIRPTEIVCLIIPLLWPTQIENRTELFKKQIKQLILFAAIIILIGGIQLIYWKIKTGHLFFTDYGNPAEGLDFLSPHTIDTLFSFRKGWFIYTPMMLLATIGFIELYRKNRKIFIPLFTFFILNLYLVSSWSCWWYAQSFSQRALIPSMVVMMIPLGYFIKYLWFKNKGLRLIGVLLIITMLALNIFQSVQYYKGVLPGDRITKDYYFATFGSLTPDQELKDKLLLIDRFHPEKKDFHDKSKYRCKEIFYSDFEGTDLKKFDGRGVFLINSSMTYSDPIRIKYRDITDKDHAFIKITANIYKTGSKSDTPSLLTASFDYRNKGYKWEKSTLGELPFNEWSTIEMIYLTPEPRTLEDQLIVQIWHRNKNSIYLDDIKIEAFEPEKSK